MLHNLKPCILFLLLLPAACGGMNAPLGQSPIALRYPYPELPPPDTTPEQSEAALEQCGLNHKIMVAPVAFCGMQDGQSQCFQMTLRIRFLGGMVLYYNSTTEDKGIVFDLGKTVNLINDPREESIWRKFSRPDASTKGYATASLSDSTLKLSIEERLIDNRSGSLMAVFGHRMLFHACQDQCHVLGYDLYADNGNPAAYQDQRLVEQSCHIE